MTSPWHEKITSALKESMQLPAWEEGFSFPWDTVSSALSEALHIPDLKISARPTDTLGSMGMKPVVFGIELAPIAGSIQWILSLDDISELISFSLSSQRQEKLIDPRLEIGFYQYVLLEAIDAIEQLRIFPDVQMRLFLEEEQIQDSALIFDVALALPSKTIYGKLALSQTFLDAFKNYEPIRQMPLLEMPEMQNKEIDLSVQAGHSEISEQEWSEVMPGDFVALDHVSFDPTEEKGSVTFLLGSSPVLRGRIKSEGIKILDDAAFYEEIAPPPEEGIELTEEENAPVSLEPQAEKTMPLSIEVTRMRLTIARLLETKPGDILDFLIRPQQGVDLISQGRRVGQGELCRLGDTLGVRVLDVER
ncbi:MAG: FliM/FliN family flagellar motor switch protein [Verrucomicrobia bacterium]|nr:FliM/FliN family flagellar motor switch protein [Verrucomicrobiota bacterium]